MNRRSFLGDMLKAGVGAMLLPSATTYARRWVRTNDIWAATPSPVILDSQLTCGSISRCQIKHLTAAEMEKLFVQDFFYGKSIQDSIKMHELEMEMIRAVPAPTSFYDFVMSRS